MRELPPNPSLCRKKFTVSYPGEIDEEIQQRLATLGMTAQQYIESLIAFDLMLEKGHAITGSPVIAGRASAWRLWQEVIAEFGNPKKEIESYTELVIKRIMDLTIALRKSSNPSQN